MASGEPGTDERTEQPTAKRREEARRKGQVVRSPDVTSALLLLGFLGVATLAGGQFMTTAVTTFGLGLSRRVPVDLTPAGALGLFFESCLLAARLVWPFVILPPALAVAIQLAQTRFTLSTESLRPQWSRVDPIAGLRRILSLHGAVELLKAALKLTAIGGVAYLTLRADWPLLVNLGQGGAGPTLATLGRVLADLWLGVAIAYLLLAGADFGYQWWQHERRLRMTKEEVRQEGKETEGDPLLRGRIRAVHRKMATRRMMLEVQRAHVVLRNPTHLAVALRYESGRMRAPRVVGKGARLMAERIIEVARQHRIPVIENRPLARALYRAVEIGQEIPRDLYRAVAEVLAYVYSLTPGRSRDVPPE